MLDAHHSGMAVEDHLAGAAFAVFPAAMDHIDDLVGEVAQGLFDAELLLDDGGLPLTVLEDAAFGELTGAISEATGIGVYLGRR